MEMQPDLKDVSGPVLAAGDPRLAEEVAPFNLSVRHRPATVVCATNADDIVAALLWAAGQGLAVGVQATGHGPVIPVDDALMVSTKRMSGVTVDAAAASARVEAGARLSDIVDAAAPHGLAPLVGSSPAVGAVGFSTGGGLSVVSRTYGFAADHIRSFEIVTADGQLRQVDAGSEPDLFWAVRGGKGNFGIVTSMVVDLFPITTLYGGAIYYPAEAIADVLHAYREWTATLPDEMTTSVALLRLPPLPFVPPPLAGKLTMALRVAFVGGSAEGEQLVAPMRRVAPALIDAVGELPGRGDASADGGAPAHGRGAETSAARTKRRGRPRWRLLRVVAGTTDTRDCGYRAARRGWRPGGDGSLVNGWIAAELPG
jgi:FAD/FMN-containing dehydrogenase